MSIKVSFDLSPMEKKFGPGNIRTAKTAVANQILTDSERFVPNDGKGYLRASFLVVMELLDSKIILHQGLELNGVRKLLMYIWIVGKR